GLASAVALAVASHPVVFGRVVKWATVPFPESEVGHVAHVWYAVFRRWGILSIAGWVLGGISFWAVMRGLGLPVHGSKDMLQAIGVSALSTVLGFVVIVLPAGLGVREVVLIRLLSGRLGASTAAVASLVIRLVWTVVEALLAGGAYGVSLTRRALRGKAVPAEVAPAVEVPSGTAKPAGEESVPGVDPPRKGASP
ncbi:MAG: hypothetical protein D6788_00955, partial [Planctomycetota bacterium]